MQKLCKCRLDAHSTEEEATRWLGTAQAAEVARQALRDEEEAIKEARRQQRLKKKASKGVVGPPPWVESCVCGNGGWGHERGFRLKQYPQHCQDCGLCRDAGGRPRAERPDMIPVLCVHLRCAYPSPIKQCLAGGPDANLAATPTETAPRS